MNERRPTTGSLVWHLAIRWRTEVDRVVAPFGLTHAQYSALASLRAMTVRGDAPTQRELAAYTGLGPIYVSKLVRKLEQSDLLTRRQDPDDARAVRLALTDRGIQVSGAAMEKVRELDSKLTAPLGGSNSDETIALQNALRTLLRETDQSSDNQENGEDS